MGRLVSSKLTDFLLNLVTAALVAAATSGFLHAWSIFEEGQSFFETDREVYTVFIEESSGQTRALTRGQYDAIQKHEHADLSAVVRISNQVKLNDALTEVQFGFVLDDFFASFKPRLSEGRLPVDAEFEARDWLPAMLSSKFDYEKHLDAANPISEQRIRIDNRSANIIGVIGDSEETSGILPPIDIWLPANSLAGVLSGDFSKASESEKVFWGIPSRTSVLALDSHGISAAQWKKWASSLLSQKGLLHDGQRLEIVSGIPDVPGMAAQRGARVRVLVGVFAVLLMVVFVARAVRGGGLGISERYAVGMRLVLGARTSHLLTSVLRFMLVDFLIILALAWMVQKVLQSLPLEDAFGLDLSQRHAASLYIFAVLAALSVLASGLVRCFSWHPGWLRNMVPIVQSERDPRFGAIVRRLFMGVQIGLVFAVVATGILLVTDTSRRWNAGIGLDTSGVWLSRITASNESDQLWFLRNLHSRQIRGEDLGEMMRDVLNEAGVDARLGIVTNIPFLDFMPVAEASLDGVDLPVAVTGVEPEFFEVFNLHANKVDLDRFVSPDSAVMDRRLTETKSSPVLRVKTGASALSRYSERVVVGTVPRIYRAEGVAPAETNVLVPLNSVVQSRLYVLVRSDTPATAIRSIVSGALRQVNPRVSIEPFQRLDDLIEQRQSLWRKASMFALLALALAVTASLVVVVSSAHQQAYWNQRNYALRAAIGAPFRALASLAIRELVLIFIIGFVISGCILSLNIKSFAAIVPVDVSSTWYWSLLGQVALTVILAAVYSKVVIESVYGNLSNSLREL